MLKKIFLLIYIILLQTILQANYDKKYEILFIMSYDTDLPWTKGITRAISDIKKTNPNIIIYKEFLDENRLGKNILEKDWINFLEIKYKYKKLDAIIAEGAFSIDVLKKYGKKFFPNVPVTLVSAGLSPNTNNDFFNILDIKQSIRKTSDLIFQLTPDKKEIILIGEEAVTTSEMMNFTKNYIESKYKDIKITIPKDFTFDGLRNSVKYYKKDSAIFYFYVFKDRDGNRIDSYDYVKELADNASVPIFSIFNVIIGRGILGGSTIDSYEITMNTIDSALRYIKTGKRDKTYNNEKTVLDNRVLEKFKINKNLLDNTILLKYKKKPIYEEYFYETIIAVIIIVFLLFIIFVLILLARTKQKLNIQLEHNVMQRTKELKQLNETLEDRITQELEVNAMQEQKIFSQSKMSSIARMVKTIGHQWKQPLSSITVLASGTKLNYELKLSDEKDLLNAFDRIVDIGEKLSETIVNFQEFFNPNEQIITFFPQQAIIKTLEIIQPIISSSNILIHSKYEGEKYQINTSYNDLTQIILNIINYMQDRLVNIKKEPKLLNIEVSHLEDKVIIEFFDNAEFLLKEEIRNLDYPVTKDFAIENEHTLNIHICKQLIEKRLFAKLEISNKEFEEKNEVQQGLSFKITIPTR